MNLLIEILFIIVLLIIVISNFIVRNLAKELKNVPNKTKLSGFEIAKKISEKVSSNPPHIIKKKGKYLDHYNYERNVIKLSPEVFDGTDIYAGIIALNIALETDNQKNKIAYFHKFTSFMVILSYLIIVIGALLNNSNIIHFSFIIFILAFLIEAIFMNQYGKTEEDLEETSKFIKTEKILEPYEEIKENTIILLLINIATLPYRFINYFR